MADNNNQLLQEQIDLLQNRQQLQDYYSRQLEEIEERQQKLGDLASRDLELQKDLMQLRRNIANSLEQEGSKAGANNVIFFEAVELLRAQNKEAKELVNELEGVVGAAKQISDNFGELLFDTLTLKSYSSSIFKNFIEASKKGLDFNEVMEEVGKNMENINVKTVLLEMALKAGFAIINLMKEATSEMVSALDEAGASLVKLTGQTGGRNLASQLFGDTAEISLYGLTIKETAKAAGDLSQSFFGFTQLSKKTRAELSKVGGLFEQAGGSAKDFADSMNLLNKSMGLSIEESVNITKSLVDLGKQLGIGQKQIQTGFNEAMKELSGFGLEGVQMFKELQVVAKKAGVEVSALTKIFGDAMDTFEGSAKTAATLNTILGAQFIDSNKLLFSSRRERIMQVLQAFEKSGKDFNSMSFFMKKSIAKRLGFSNIQEAMSILGKSSAEYAKSLEKMEEAKKATKPLEDLAKTAATLSQKFTALKAQFAIFVKPIVEFTTFLVDALLRLSKSLGTFGKAVMLVSGVLLAGVTAWGVYKLALFAAAKGTTVLGGALAGAGQALGAFGAGAAKAIPILLAIAAVIASIGVAAGGAALLLNSIMDAIYGSPERIKAQAEMAKVIKDMQGFKADPLIKEFNKFFNIFTDPKIKAFFKFAAALKGVSENMKQVSSVGGGASAVVSSVTNNQKEMIVLKTNTVKLSSSENAPIIKFGDIDVTFTGDKVLDSQAFKDAMNLSFNNNIKKVTSAQ